MKEIQNGRKQDLPGVRSPGIGRRRERQLSNIDSIFNAVLLGATAYPYHADGKQCKLYSAADIVTLYTAKQSTITQQTTYNNSLRQWISRETSLEVLKGISYGVELPEDLKAEVADILQKAKEQVEAIAKKLGER